MRGGSSRYKTPSVHGVPRDYAEVEFLGAIPMRYRGAASGLEYTFQPQARVKVDRRDVETLTTDGMFRVMQ